MQSFATPQILYDLNLNFGEDLSVSPSGDLDLVSGAKKSEQRVLRRLLTSIGGYIWHPEYGAGMPSFIGQEQSDDNFDQLKSNIIANLFKEDSVSQSPPPKITMQSVTNGIFTQIIYTENPSQNQIVLNYTLKRG